MKPKPRKPRKQETLLRYIGDSNNVAQKWLMLDGDHVNEVNSCINRIRALLSELRAALKQTKERRWDQRGK